MRLKNKLKNASRKMLKKINYILIGKWWCHVTVSELSQMEKATAFQLGKMMSRAFACF